MDSLVSGTFVGAGSFCCRQCGYALTLSGTDSLTDCPGCGGTDFVRASLFSTERITGGRAGSSDEATLVEPAPFVIVPRAQATIPFPLVKVPSVVLAETRTAPGGRVSNTKASEARFGPRFSIVSM